MKDNCTNCMFSKYDESTMVINDEFDQEYMICSHQNSPYYDEIVNDEQTCRLYIDSKKYFLRKDRKDKLNKIKNSGKL